MSSEFGELGFAGALAQSRAMQSIVRVMQLYSAKHPGPCSFIFKKGDGDDGVGIDFGTGNETGASTGLADLLSLIEMTDQLMFLEAMISNLRDRHADREIIDDLIGEAKVLIEKMYPGMAIADEPVSVDEPTKH